MLDDIKNFLIQYSLIPVVCLLLSFIAVHVYRRLLSQKKLSSRWKFGIITLLGCICVAVSILLRLVILRSVFRGMINPYANDTESIATISETDGELDEIFSAAGAPVDGVFYCNTIPNVPQDRRSNKSKLVVMHFNAEFAFSSVVVDKMQTRKKKPFNFPYNDMDEHAKHVAMIVDKYEPDIINLCEISDCAALEYFLSNMSKKELYRPYVVSQYDRETHQACGMLTKVDPVQELVSFKPKETAQIVPSDTCGVVRRAMHVGKRKTVSKGYRARFLINDIPIVLMGLHLIAFPNILDRCMQREAQAHVVANDLVEGPFHNPLNDEVVVLGDFNDFDWEVNPKKLKLNEPASSVVRIIKASRNLQSVLSKVDYNRRFTVISSGKKRKEYTKNMTFETLDHAFVSKNIFDTIGVSQVASFYRPWSDKRCSDHFPIWFEIDLDALARRRNGEEDVVPKKYRTLEDLPDVSKLPTCIDSLKSNKYKLYEEVTQEEKSLE